MMAHMPYAMSRRAQASYTRKPHRTQVKSQTTTLDHHTAPPALGCSPMPILTAHSMAALRVLNDIPLSEVAFEIFTAEGPGARDTKGRRKTMERQLDGMAAYMYCDR